MTEPSIKGTAIETLVSDVCRLVEEGHISDEQIEACLQPEDLRLLEEKIQIAVWYPIASYRRLSELLLELEGQGRPQYVVERGARAAARLFDSGIYYQLQRGAERAAELRRDGDGWTRSDGNLMASLSGAIFNFSRWRFEVASQDPVVYRIEASEATELPEVARLAAQGFIEHAASRVAGVPFTVKSARVSDDRIVFTLIRSSEASR